MSQKFYIKSGDTGPAINATLKDSDGDVIDLSGASVRFHMSRQKGRTATVNYTASVVGTASLGKVSYSWRAGDTATPGTYFGEFEVTFASLVVESFPNFEDLEIIITDDVA